MLGVNEIKSAEEIPTDTVIGLCEGLLTRMEEADMRRMVRTDKDRYYRTLKTQFKRLDDRYPGIFNMLIQYGRRNPQGLEIMPQIEKMLRQRDAIFSRMKQNPEMSREDAGKDEDKAVDYTYAQRYVRPAIGAERFDSIVKPPEEREEDQ
jgi:hypothetical protein